MPVNLSAPDPGDLLPVKGVRLGVAEAGIRKPNRKDLLVASFPASANVAAVFTQNRFCAAPVIVAKRHLALGTVRSLVVNTGCANAGTGEDGVSRADAVCEIVGRHLGCKPSEVMPFSTGVIMEPLPVDRIAAAIPKCVAAMTEHAWFGAAEAIMTTDTVPKAASRMIRIGEHNVSITGIAKGSGMIRPDMATMLAFLATDAAISREMLQAMATHAARHSFNCVTVDGDTSTNDSFVLVATAQSGIPEISRSDIDGYEALLDAVTSVCVELAQALVRDGEGASKFITIRVEGGSNDSECRKVAFAIAHSPLVKTAFYASDPNLGRILAAIGYAGITDLDPGRVDLYLDEILVVRGGGRAQSYDEQDGQRIMKKPEVTVRVMLNRGRSSAIVWTCDLSHEYVRINSDYRS